MNKEKTIKQKLERVGFTREQIMIIQIYMQRWFEARRKDLYNNEILACPVKTDDVIDRLLEKLNNEMEVMK